MRPLLYIGATLMIGAGIYGFIDLKEKTKRNELQSLYRKEARQAVKKPIPVRANPAPLPDTLAIVKKDTVVAAATKKPKKLNAKLYSRAALEVVPLPEPEIKKEQ